MPSPSYLHSLRLQWEQDLTVPNALCPLNPTLPHLFTDLLLFRHAQLGLCSYSTSSTLSEVVCDCHPATSQRHVSDLMQLALQEPWTQVSTSSFFKIPFSFVFYDIHILLVFLLFLGPPLLISFSSIFIS